MNKKEIDDRVIYIDHLFARILDKLEHYPTGVEKGKIDDTGIEYTLNKPVSVDELHDYALSLAKDALMLFFIGSYVEADRKKVKHGGWRKK